MSENTCKVEWCNRKPHKSGKGFCRMHYDQIRKYGHTTNYRPAGSRNEYLIKDECAELNILDSEGNIKATALIDKEDVEKLRQYSFRIHNNGYVSTQKNGKTMYLHQIVLNFKELKEKETDHINRNKLDNRKCNLRICTHLDNAHNRKPYNKFGTQGVKKSSRNLKKPFLAGITLNGEWIYLGYYSTAEEAIEVRNKAEKEIYKEFSTV